MQAGRLASGQQVFACGLPLARIRGNFVKVVNLPS